MENSEDLTRSPKVSPAQRVSNFDAAPKKHYDNDDSVNKNALESTVSWIGQDSKSQSKEYLEECNSHQSGE